MKSSLRMIQFVRPYAGISLLAMVLLVGVVAADLAIPRLTQQVINEGILKQDMQVMRGVNLSGGQKQRLAIARVLLVQPKILILDDGTSVVDVETESKIQANLEQLLAGCTRFVVAQRISTVLNADKIVILDRGQIAAEGTHAELLAGSSIWIDG